MQMADSPRSPDIDADPPERPGREASTGMPRWVKVSAIIAAVVVVLVIVLMLVGGGEHGPGRHMGGGSGGGHTAPLGLHP
jgi:hypothetical protein